MRRAFGDDPTFALITVSVLLVAHAIAYPTHEHQSSFAARALGYMAHPLALDYGRFTLPTPVAGHGHGAGACVRRPDGSKASPAT